MLFLIIIIPGLLLSQTDIKAVTEQGKSVILHADGTWEYDNTRKATDIHVSGTYQVPVNSKMLLKTRVPHFSIYIDDNKWVEEANDELTSD